MIRPGPSCGKKICRLRNEFRLGKIDFDRFSAMAQSVVESTFFKGRQSINSYLQSCSVFMIIHVSVLCGIPMQNDIKSVYFNCRQNYAIETPESPLRVFPIIFTSPISTRPIA